MLPLEIWLIIDHYCKNPFLGLVCKNLYFIHQSIYFKCIEKKLTSSIFNMTHCLKLDDVRYTNFHFKLLLNHMIRFNQLLESSSLPLKSNIHTSYNQFCIELYPITSQIEKYVDYKSEYHYATFKDTIDGNAFNQFASLIHYEHRNEGSIKNCLSYHSDHFIICCFWITCFPCFGCLYLCWEND